MQAFLGVIVSVFVWNWLSGFIGALPLAALVLKAHKRFEDDPSEENRAAAVRWTCRSYLLNYGVNALGLLLICLSATTFGLPWWGALVVFGVRFVFFILPQVLDAIARLDAGDTMPDAYHG